jgi:RNA polymerase sigma-70 factor (ECF subfamily)
LESPAAWVRTVAWRLAVSHFRRRQVADRFLIGLRRRPAEEPLPETAWDLDDALRRLNPVFREALVLHDLCGYPVEQIARECGVAVGTVKSRLSRGRTALAGALGPDYRESSAKEESR